MKFELMENNIDFRLFFVVLIFTTYFLMGVYLCYYIRKMNKDFIDKVNRISKGEKVKGGK